MVVDSVTVLLYAQWIYITIGGLIINGLAYNVILLRVLEMRMRFGMRGLNITIV